MDTLFFMISIFGILIRPVTGESVRCFECDNMPTPVSCNAITTCAENESCFLEQAVTTSGHLVYNSGCEYNTRCAIQSGRRAIVSRNSDILTCRECCTGSHCNNRGCGVPGVDHTQRGLYCYTCPSLNNPADCEIVSICTENERCLTHIRTEFLGLQTQTIYASECESIEACHTLETIGKGQCCNTDFCNDNYNLSVVTTPQTVTLSSALHNTPTNIQNNPTTTYLPTIVPTVVNINTTVSATAIVSTIISTASTKSFINASTKAPSNAPTDTTTSKPTPTQGHHCDTSGRYERHVLGNDEEFCVRVIDGASLGWEDAKASCNGENARLVVVDSAEKLSIVRDTVQRYGGNHNYWIGLRDRDHNNKYYWLDGGLISYSDWGQGQPNFAFHGHNEDCVLLYNPEHYKMHDAKCADRQSYVCERI